MIKNSFFYNLWLSIWMKFIFYYKNSFLYKIVSSIIDFCMNIWNASFIRKILFDDFGFERKFRNSFFGKIFGLVTKLTEWTSIKMKDVVDNSLFISYFKKLFDNLLYISTVSYGCLFFSFGVYCSIMTVIRGLPRNVYLSLGLFSIVFGILLMIINKTLAGLYNGSFFAKLVGEYFGLGNLPEKRYKKSYHILFIVIGIIFSMIFIQFGILVFTLFAGGLIGASLVIYKTEIGIFATAFFIPLLPTKYILALALLTIISYIFKIFLTGTLSFRPTLIDMFVLMFGLLILYSIFISYFPNSSAYMGGVYLLFIMFYFVVKNTIDSKDKLYALISIIVISGTLVSLYGIYQNYTGNYLDTTAWLDSEMFEGSKPRIYSTLDNPNVLGEYLLFIIPLAFAMLYYYDNLFFKFVALGVLAVSAYCMLLTQSRGAWLGLIFAFTIFIFLKDRRLLWFGVLGFLLAPFILPRSIIDRFLSIGNMSDGSTSYRVNIWLASWLMLKTFWPIGIGLGTDTFVYIYKKYAFNAIQAPHSHNLYLQIAIDLGIIGLILFLCFVFVFFKTILIKTKKANKDKFYTSVGAALCAGMGGYLLQGLTDNVWYNYRVVIFFWLILGLTGAFMNIGNRSKRQRRISK